MLVSSSHPTGAASLLERPQLPAERLLAQASSVKDITELRGIYEAAFGALKQDFDDGIFQDLLYAYASRCCYGQDKRDGLDFPGFELCARLMEVSLELQLQQHGALAQRSELQLADLLAASSLDALVKQLQADSRFGAVNDALGAVDFSVLLQRLSDEQLRALGDVLMRLSFSHQNMPALSGAEFHDLHRATNAATLLVLDAGPDSQDRHMEYFYNRHVFIQTLGIDDAQVHFTRSVEALKEIGAEYGHIYKADSPVCLQKQGQLANRRGLTILHGIAQKLGGDLDQAIACFQDAIQAYKGCSLDATAWAPPAEAAETLTFLRYNAYTGLASALVDAGRADEAEPLARELQRYLSEQELRGNENSYFAGYRKVIAKVFGAK